MEERKEGDWLCRVKCMRHTYRVIKNPYLYWTIKCAFKGLCVYTKLQTWWHTNCSHRSLNSLSHTSLHSHYNNTVIISTVVVLGFWLCQFNTGSLTLELGLSSTTAIFVW